MTQEQREALAKSVEHWRQICECKTAAQAGQLLGRGQCACCQIWNNKEESSEEDCIGCPIFEHTGKRYCGGTPVNVAYEAIDTPLDGWRAAAKLELGFLSDLLTAP